MRRWLLTSVFLVSTIRYDDITATRNCQNQLSNPVILAETGRSTKHSTVTSTIGHWPPHFCKITNVYLNSLEQTFVIHGNTTSVDACYGTRDIWDFRSHSSVGLPGCDQIFDTAYVFTIYYHYGSNYFHLHYDTTLPIYFTLYHNQSRSKRVVLMPSVEKQRGKGTDWNTDAFMDESTYWMSLLKVFAGESKMLPLDKRLVAMQKTICFKEIFFGTPKFNVSSTEVLSGYTNMIKSHLNVNASSQNSITKRLALIHRSGRRKILNEDELLKNVAPIADIQLLDFKQLTFKQQVEAMQRYNVLIGMNGAGLINALYLPSSSVAIQLVPYAAQLNYREYGELLRARGPYLEWHNTHENNSVPVPGDFSCSNDNTIVDVDEFLQLIRKALKMLES